MEIKREVMYMSPNNFNLSENPKWTESEEHGDRITTTLVEGIPIDKGIAEAVSILNKKGFRTLFSCEGHRDSVHSYILFEDNVPIDEIKFLLKYTSMWKFNEKDYRELSRLVIEADIPLKLFSSLNENDENIAGYEYIKKAYLNDILEAAERVGEIEVADQSQIRPVVNHVKLSKSGTEMVIKFTIFDFEKFYEDYGRHIRIGDIIRVENDDYTGDFKIIDAKFDTDRINIKAKNIEPLLSILTLYLGFITDNILYKRVLFKKLGDF